MANDYMVAGCYQGNRFHGEEGGFLVMIFSVRLFDQHHVLNTDTKLSILIETRLYNVQE